MSSGISARPRCHPALYIVIDPPFAFILTSYDCPDNRDHG